MNINDNDKYFDGLLFTEIKDKQKLESLMCDWDIGIITDEKLFTEIHKLSGSNLKLKVYDNITFNPSIKYNNDKYLFKKNHKNKWIVIKELQY